MSRKTPSRRMAMTSSITTARGSARVNRIVNKIVAYKANGCTV